MEDFPKFLFRTPYVLYGKRVVHFEKWTGGGKSTLMTPTDRTVPGDPVQYCTVALPGTVQYCTSTVL